MEDTPDKALEIVAYYTLAASATGAVPVPATSAAVAAENGLMLAHIASAMGAPLDISTIAGSIGIAGSLNVLGRTIFIEGAKLLSWGTGSIWAALALSALGATTAGMQTYLIGRIAIEICKNHGQKLESAKAQQIIDDAKASYDDFVAYWKTKKIAKPGT